MEPWLQPCSDLGALSPTLISPLSDFQPEHSRICSPLTAMMHRAAPSQLLCSAKQCNCGHGEMSAPKAVRKGSGPSPCHPLHGPGCRALASLLGTRGLVAQGTAMPNLAATGCCMHACMLGSRAVPCLPIVSAAGLGTGLPVRPWWHGDGAGRAPVRSPQQNTSTGTQHEAWGCSHLIAPGGSRSPRRDGLCRVADLLPC